MPRDNHHDLDEHTKSVLAAHEVPAAPSGFAARMRRLAEQDREASVTASGRSRRPGRFVAGMGVGLGVAAAIVVLWTLRGEDHSASGRHIAEQRVSLNVGARAVAVTEPGADVSWSVSASGAAHVTQRAGSVFYRVDDGKEFVVETPLGTITVTGTCFRVEMIMKNSKKNLKAATVGALAATAVVVSVYEGRVLFANDHGEVPLEAGAVASAKPNDAPVVAQSSGTEDGSRIAYRAQLEAARQRIEELEGQLEADDHSEESDAVDGASPQEGRYFAPSAEELHRMAETCWVAYDRPPFSAHETPVLVTDEMAANSGLSAEDVAGVNEAYAAVNAAAVKELRDLYVEVTGDRAGAESLSVSSLQQEILNKSRAEDELEARRRISAERAGLEDPPTDLTSRPAIERMLRLQMDLGHRAEKAAADVLGAGVAHGLRTDNGVGWHSTVTDYGGCSLRDSP